MKSIRLRLRISLSLFVLVTVSGTVGFMYFEKLSFVDSLYYNIVTMATVGYGDIAPKTVFGRLFAIFIIVMGGATFLGVIANATELMLLDRERHSRLRKVNMVLGVFFSELGCRLLHEFAMADKNIVKAAEKLLVRQDWRDQDFASAMEEVRKHVFEVDIHLIDFRDLGGFLVGKRGFLVGLLENPVLIEQEDFSEALLAVFHLADELASRDDFNTLPETDRKHLGGDMNRVYQRLVVQWLFHLQHLKGHYPYLFSLAVRKNPFDREASPVVNA